MNILYGAVFLIFASIEARKSPDIQIFEIRDRGNNGIELRDLAFNPKSRLKVESKLLNLIQSKKHKNTQNYITEKLIEELNNLKGDEGNKISDDTYIYVLRNSFENFDSTSKEDFLDKAQNDRAVEQSIKNLEKLLRRKSKNRAKSNSQKRFGSNSKGHSNLSA